MERQPKTPSTKGPAAYFTGEVYYDVIAAGESPSRLRVNLVRFAPGARTAWHRHTNGQTLHVTQGAALMQARGGEILVVRPGETVYTPPGEWHWHGATAEDFMEHLAMWEGLGEGEDGPETEWGEQVEVTPGPAQHEAIT